MQVWPSRSLQRVCIPTAMMIALGTLLSPANGSICITTTNGKRLYCQSVHQGANSAELILEIRQPGIRMSRRVALSRVSSVTIDGSTYTVKQFQLLADRRTSQIKNPVRKAQTQQHQTLRPIRQMEWQKTDGAETRMASFPRTDLPVRYPRSKVIGMRDAPLNAYSDLVEKHFPNGVPASETGFVLFLMRDVKANQVLFHSSQTGWRPIPVDPDTKRIDESAK